jgi:hypothetical protein
MARMVKPPPTLVAKKPKRPPRIPEVGKRPRPMRPDKHTIKPQGPRWANVWRSPQRMGYGPGDPPEEFLSNVYHGSASEWRFYWALAKVLGSPKDPRQGPYVGGDNWGYQKAADGAHVRAIGSQVLDFVVDMNGTRIGLRIQTERWHVMASSTVQVKDKLLRTNTKGVDIIIDLFDQWSIADSSGKAVIDQIIRALKGIPDVDPITNGTARQVRTPRWA